MTLPPTAEMSQSGTLLTGERHVLELIATGAGLQDILDALCRVIDEQSGLMSSVFLLDRTGKQMTLAAGPHLPDAWRQTITSLAVTPTSTSCGAAVSSRGQVIVTDVATSPLSPRGVTQRAYRASRACGPP